MDRLKIFVYGFAHSGTTILKKIIGDHPDVYEVIGECYEPPDFEEKKHLVFKYPHLPDPIHDECKRLMIMKNPWDIFGSYFLRYGEKYLKITNHTIADYFTFLEHFTKTDDYKIRYEDLFEPDAIKKIFYWLGLEFTGIIDRPVYCSSDIEIPDEKPALQEEGPWHGKYRTWQINQPLQNMTGQSAPNLDPDICHKFLVNDLVMQVYGDFKHLSNRCW